VRVNIGINYAAFKEAGETGRRGGPGRGWRTPRRWRQLAGGAGFIGFVAP